MPGAKHKRFDEHTKEGKEFIKLWNKADRDGIQKKLADKYDLSISLVYRIRKKLGLADLHSKDHPGKRKLIKRIRKHYWQGKSSIVIGRIVRMSPENIRKMLQEEGVKMRPSHVTDPLYFSFKNNNEGHTKILKEIKKLYVDERMSAANIAKKLNLDQGAVSKKLKAMNIPLRQNHKELPGGYPCQWCGEIMETVWQNKGLRKQKFCCGKCKNKAKDYRRMNKGQKYSENRLEIMNRFLLETWGSGAQDQIKKILEVRTWGSKK